MKRIAEFVFWFAVVAAIVYKCQGYDFFEGVGKDFRKAKERFNDGYNEGYHQADTIKADTIIIIRK